MQERRRERPRRMRDRMWTNGWMNKGQFCLRIANTQLTISSQDVTWFKPWEAVNPVIHRIKEAVFHASLTPDLDKDPLGPPHPELTKYFETPSELAEKVKDVTVRLREVLDIKKVPEKRKRRKAQKEELGEDEGL